MVSHNIKKMSDDYVARKEWKEENRILHQKIDNVAHEVNEGFKQVAEAMSKNKDGSYSLLFKVTGVVITVCSVMFSIFNYIITERALHTKELYDINNHHHEEIMKGLSNDTKKNNTSISELQTILQTIYPKRDFNFTK